jgi:hypothetical protein
VPRKLMKKKAKLNGNSEVRSMAFQPVPRQFDLIRNRRVRYLKSLGLSNSQIADGVLGDRPQIAIVTRRIHEGEAAHRTRRQNLMRSRAAKREKKFVELALNALAAAIEGKCLWIKGEYSLSFAQGLAMASSETRLQLAEIEAKIRAKGAESAATFRPWEWRWFMELGDKFVAEEVKAGRRSPLVSRICARVSRIAEGKLEGIGGLGRDFKKPIDYKSFTRYWSIWKLK